VPEPPSTQASGVCCGRDWRYPGSSDGDRLGREMDRVAARVDYYSASQDRAIWVLCSHFPLANDGFRLARDHFAAHSPQS